jgi:segregation and condensation protein B
VDKPISAPRLAEALGLIEDADDPAQATPLESPAEPAADHAEKPAKKKSKKDRAPTPIGLIQAAIALLNDHYENANRSFRVQGVAGGYRIMTLPKFAPVLEQYHGRRERHGVSRAALETLAIIAYKQPMTRASLEAIRGVACGEVLRSLIERRLVTIVGRAEELGRPMLYGTTKAFLETFGLATLKDLPTAEDLRLGGADDAERDEDSAV